MTEVGQDLLFVEDWPLLIQNMACSGCLYKKSHALTIKIAKHMGQCSYQDYQTIIRFWETAHLPLPLANILPYVRSVNVGLGEG